MNGRVIKILKTVEPISGKDLILTLDLVLQQQAESLLGENDGAVVALDPSNGDVLVMASAPVLTRMTLLVVSPGRNGRFYGMIRAAP